MKKLMSFVVDYWVYVFKGGPKFYAWLGFLCIFVVAWTYGNFMQLSEGMIVTGLTDQVSWGLYLANFVFLVGVAAGAVTVVFPAYVYKHKALHEVAVLGEMLAIAAVIMCMLFVLNHMGRPDRLWHMLPFIGIYNWPGSMLTWDVIVLVGYLILNIIGGFYYLYKKVYPGAAQQELLHADHLHRDRLGAEHPYGHGVPDQYDAGKAHVAPRHDADPVYFDGLRRGAGTDHHRVHDRA